MKKNDMVASTTHNVAFASIPLLPTVLNLCNQALFLLAIALVALQLFSRDGVLWFLIQIVMSALPTRS